MTKVFRDQFHQIINVLLGVMFQYVVYSDWAREAWSHPGQSLIVRPFGRTAGIEPDKEK
ncbi:MAG: hypothetical protein H0V34_10615 [Gammaproteobacteria bacterium]|nr:hypothetical protein [Gammaproteobacteria bacterium]